MGPVDLDGAGQEERSTSGPESVLECVAEEQKVQQQGPRNEKDPVQEWVFHLALFSSRPS